ncbi:hypothetical protein ABFU55_09560 [Xanthomonas campestris pv. raphani]|uniref:hypothetical protein n=1 Tax=Xanthomonas campestris TaxID=339 RepID=UPI0038910427
MGAIVGAKRWRREGARPSRRWGPLRADFHIGIDGVTDLTSCIFNAQVRLMQP